MSRRPTPAWFDRARDDAATIGEPLLGGEAPAVDAPRHGENDNAGAMPSIGLSAGVRSAALLPGGPARGRRLGVAMALILSTVIHAAAFVWLAGNLSVEGMEADTDGVSVEIVFHTPDTSASPAIAGNDGAEVADAEPAEVVEQTLAEAMEPEAASPVDTEMAEAVDADVADTVEAQPIEETAAEAEAVLPDPFPQAETVVAEPSDPVEVPEAIEPVVKPDAPAFTPPAPDAAALALLAAPPSVEALAILDPVPDNAAEDALPETVERVPEPRPEPPATEAKTAGRQPTRTAKTQARAVEPSRKSASAETEPNARKAPAKADAVARSAKKTAKRADAGRKPAAAASVGSQARAAAAPGAKERYGRKLLSHVERHKRYPAAALRAGISGATRLAITIDRSGGLAGARISASSGHQILDQEALAVARRAAPYPRPPDGVGGSTFSVSVTLRFTR